MKKENKQKKQPEKQKREYMHNFFFMKKEIINRFAKAAIRTCVF